MLENLKKFDIILASKSPRRKQLLSSLGIEFTTATASVDEVYPEDLAIEKIPGFLAELKLQAFTDQITEEKIIITADTIVCLNEEVLGKPADENEAFEMLSKLSGKTHQVSTGVCIAGKYKKSTFTATTNVFFKKLDQKEIEYYIANYKPFDKAGAYGIQEWIGHVAVEKIEGSYFNVMGLPVHGLYEELLKF